MAEEQGRKNNEPSGKSTSWLIILFWIGLAFFLAGLIAYRLVTPFFHRA